MNWFIKNLHIFVAVILVLVLLGVLGNAIYEGYFQMVTQERIDDSYRLTQ